MNISRMAGTCLILLGIINVLHAIYLTGTSLDRPGIPYMVVTALLFTIGAALLLRPRRERTMK